MIVYYCGCIPGYILQKNKIESSVSETSVGCNVNNNDNIENYI